MKNPYQITEITFAPNAQQTNYIKSLNLSFQDQSSQTFHLKQLATPQTLTLEPIITQLIKIEINELYNSFSEITARF